VFHVNSLFPFRMAAQDLTGSLPRLCWFLQMLWLTWIWQSILKE